MSSYKDGAGNECEWGDEVLCMVVAASAANGHEMKIEVWNENAPAPDVLIGRW